MKKLFVFASGSAEGGGSGFENLVQKAHSGALNAEIVGVASNHKIGGVYEKALRLNVPFIFLEPPWTAELYRNLVAEYGADFAALSGWLKLARGLDPRTTINIHPGPLPRFGGTGMYGHHVHEAVMEAYKRGEVTHSAVTMHFVTEEYDRGPIFFQRRVPILESDTPETLAKRVNAAEHEFQPLLTDAVVNGRIAWDGINSSSLKINL